MKSRYAAALLVLLATTACHKEEKPYFNGMKIGKPYQIYGRWYKPEYDANYDEIGKASWYGPGFHGGRTANGERFDQDDLTAAHRTLPLPSIVRVTNLDNGRSTIVRINDRGPFSHERILDLSKAAAKKLDVIRTGTAKVRVQYLEQETKDYISTNYGEGARAAMEKMKTVDPVQAGNAQDTADNAKFYVMKVPAGEAPPPDSVPVSDEAAVNYPTKNIFEPVDDATSEKAVPEPVARVLNNDHPDVKAAQEHDLSEEQPVHRSHTVSTAPLQNGGYYVQAGTFGAKENADHLIEKLGDDSNAKIVNVTTAGNHTLYRVMVGPYKQETAAKKMLSKVGAIGIPDAKIIRN